MHESWTSFDAMVKAAQLDAATMNLQSALAIVKAAGYRVTKPKAKLDRAALGLNAIGKPYGENYDPNYRRNYKPPLVPGRSKPQSFTPVSPEKWECMCAFAKTQWQQWERGEIDAVPRNIGQGFA